MKFSDQHWNSEFEFTTVVADINTNGILGFDFLRKNRCLVDQASAKMYIGESEPGLKLKGRLACFNVSLNEIVCPPSTSEMISPDPLSLSFNKQKREHLVMCPPKDLKKR